MTRSKHWVASAMQVLNYNEQELAKELSVTLDKIKNWKDNNEDLPWDIEEKFRGIFAYGSKLCVFFRFFRERKNLAKLI